MHPKPEPIALDQEMQVSNYDRERSKILQSDT
jgi:hypothetical protein